MVRSCDETGGYSIIASRLNGALHRSWRKHLQKEINAEMDLCKQTDGREKEKGKGGKSKERSS